MSPPSRLSEARLPIGLLIALAPVLVLTFLYCREGRLNWLLEVGPALLGFIALANAMVSLIAATGYVGVFVHTLILVYGGTYTYAKAPLGDWAKEAFHLSRNHYDRVGHLALGFFPVLIIKETLLRAVGIKRGGWLWFLALSVVMAIAAFYELIEWWSTYLVAPDVGQAFLGSQGDVWDAQWDMLLGLVGGALGLALLGRVHDRSMARRLSTLT